jgi:hypothetical protein
LSDIAEWIIEALPREGADDRKDAIEVDHQLQSDLETFEGFTAKLIQREDAISIWDDEIVMEDIERSL